MAGSCGTQIQRLTVRQSEKRDINIFEGRQIFGRFFKPQIRQPEQIFMHLADRLSRVFIRRHQNYFSVRMKQQNPQKLAAAVTRTAEDCDFYFLIH